MLELEIDGKTVKIQEGATIIEAADSVGIYIPRFCYHKKLTIAANCRMCLVEVEKSPKPLPACATPVTAQMKVFTSSDKALEAQRAVMEYLLINHPLDCPICDQGGECELQDLAMGFGKPYSYYDFTKRAVYSENLGPLIETEMTRCIQCTRCVRFGEEIAGLKELGVISRGENEQISTYVKHFMRSELSGNIIDLCPVGALTAKPSEYTVRGWELREHPSISPHDCIGSNLYIHTRFQEYSPQRIVMRVVPRENENINETWISDRDRFSYQGLYHADRVYNPRIKKDSQWHEVSWQEALEAIANRLLEMVKNNKTDQIAALASPNSTVEEFYLLQKIMRSLGSNHVDHRLHEQDFRDQQTLGKFPELGMPITEIETLSAILLVGSDVRTEQPLINQRINKASQENAEIIAINPVDYLFTYPVNEKIIQRNIVSSLAEVAKALADISQRNFPALEGFTPSAAAKTIAEKLKNATKAGIFIGPHATNHPDASQIRILVRLIRELSGARLGILTEGANSSGAWLAGMIPHRGPGGTDLKEPGLNAKSLLTDQPRSVYLLLNIEPEFDSSYSEEAVSALEKAECVICFNTFVTPRMGQYADIILPIAPFTESGGTFVNVEGTWQSFLPVSIPQQHSRPAWQVLSVLGKFLHLEKFDYKSVENIRDEIKNQISTMANFFQAKSNGVGDYSSLNLSHLNQSARSQEFIRLAPWHMYRVDPLVRRAQALQETITPDFFSVSINQKMADQLNFAEGDTIRAIQGDSHVLLPLVINNRLSDYTVLIFSGLKETVAFGQHMSEVILEKIEKEIRE